MHLTSADARAAREGFHFVVMRGGTRVAYTTTAAEAKRECGKGCKVYPLARMRYTAQNPAKGELSLVGRDGKPLHLACFEYAGPFARTEEIKRGNTLETIKDDADSITHIPTGLTLYSGVLAGRTVGGPARKKLAVAAMKALRGWLKTLSPEQVHTITHGFTMGSAKLTPAQDKLLREAYNLCRSAGYAVDSTRNPASKRTQLASLDRRIKAAEAAGMPVAYLLEQRDLLARRKKANPGLTKAGKRHLIQTMHKAGADTFTKKMRYVRKHMPHITDPAAFVGYVMQGEKR